MKFPSITTRVVLLAATALVVAGCGSSSNKRTDLRVVHAVADAPLVNVYLNGVMQLSNVDFRNGTGYMRIPAGNYDIRVEAIVPGGTVDVIDARGVPLAKGERTTVYAAGTTATIAPWLVAGPTGNIAAGNLRAQVVHASPDAPEVSVLVSTPGAALTDAVNLGSFEFGETLGPVEVPAGEYQIRVAVGAGPVFTGGDVVFDSGPLMLPAGADLQIAAVTSTVNGDSPITLIVLDGAGAADLFDIGTGADVRVVHNSPDAPAVDIVVNDNFAEPAVTGLEFTEFTGVLNLPEDSYNFKVAATADQSIVAIDFDADLLAGTAYTVIANGFLLSTPPIGELVLVDNNRRVATAAKLRLVHGSPSTGNVDIYLLPAGALPGDAGSEPAFTGVPFGAETGFVDVAPGTYDVYVTPAGDSSTLAISATGIDLDVLGIYTAIARDNTGGAGGAPLGLILLDDFAP